MIKINERLMFTDKKSLYSFIKEYRQNQKYPIQLNDWVFDIVRFFYVNYHPNGAELKSVKQIYIKHNDVFNGKKFEFILENGETQTPSLTKCVRSVSYNTTVKKTMREVIAEQVNLYKKRYFKEQKTALCEITGVQLSWNEANVDHVAPTFINLLSNFLSKKGLNYTDVELISLPYGGYALVNSTLKEEWYNYHQQHAKLRVISIKEHKKINNTTSNNQH